MAKTLYLIVDIGGHSVRSIVYDGECNCLAKYSQVIAVQNPQPAYVEHSAQEIINAVVDTAGQCLQWLSSRQRTNLVMGLATQRSSIICWSRSTGLALSAVLSWQDTRARDALKNPALDIDEFKIKTGLVFSPHYGASKIQWCLLKLRPVQEALAQNDLVISPLAAYILANITTGVSPDTEVLIDAVHAARTMLCNISTCTWDTSLLQQFSIPQRCLPKIVDNEYDFGSAVFSNAVPGPVGVPVPVPVRLVIGDQSAALFANGSIEENALYINIGSGAFILGLSQPGLNETEATIRAVTDAGLLNTLVYKNARKKIMAVEGTVNGASNALSWFQHKSKTTCIPRYQNLIKSPLSRGYFVNGVGGLGSPYWKSAIESRFVECNTNDEKYLAIYESILFLLFNNYQIMKRFISPVKVIYLSGGLSVDHSFCQSLANLFSIDTVSDDDYEATSRGVAYLLAGKDKPSQQVMHSTCFKSKDDLGLIKRFKCWIELMDN